MDHQTHHTTLPSLRCHQCSMVFSSIKQLSMHREKFCVGSNRRPYDPYSMNNEQRLADEKIRQLRAMKEANLKRNHESQQRDRLVLSQSSMSQRPPSIAAQSELKQQLRQQEDEKLRLYEGSDREVIEDLKNQIHTLRASQSGWPNHQPSQRQTSRPALEFDRRETSHPAPEFKPREPSHPAPEFTFSGGPLVAEISALRQYYVDKGGQDPLIVRQLSEMMRDADALQTNPPRQSYNASQHEPKTPNSPQSSEELIAMEMENYRLQRELILLEGNQRSAAGHSASHFNNRLQQLQLDHNARIVSLEREVELARHQALLDALRLDIRPSHQQQTELPTKYYRPVSDIAKSSYDPVQGFVCYYDFVMGMESSSRHCKLFVGMYNKLVELGEPSFLPTVYTEVSEGGTTAMIGARQRIPQCPPSNDLSLVVELQTSDSSPDDLRTKAWLKVDLFDPNKTLLTGAWKIMFRVLPIKPDHLTSAIASYPQHANAALYMRVVHQRDSHNHSENVISPANYVDYKTPPLLVTTGPTHKITPYSWDS